jgi:cell division protein FtsI/penicillin-binding protein 2
VEGQRDHAVFVAVAPWYAPRWVVAVVLREGGYGVNAGRVAGRILNRVDQLARQHPAE